MIGPYDPWVLLALSCWIGGAAVGLTLVGRRVPPIAAWVREGKKPWACNVCAATWSTLAIDLALCASSRDPWLVLTWLPALALATIGLHLADPPSPPDFVLPEGEP